MARQPQDARRFGLTVDVTSAGINVLANASAPVQPAESGRKSGSSSEATAPADASRPVTGPPSLLGMATSFVGSMAKFAASGFKRVDEPSHRLRIRQCDPCEYRTGSRCTFCGCFVAKKAWLPHEDCPIGRWPK